MPLPFELHLELTNVIKFSSNVKSKYYQVRSILLHLFQIFEEAHVSSTLENSSSHWFGYSAEARLHYPLTYEVPPSKLYTF
jgi:hypothetical protein